MKRLICEIKMLRPYGRLRYQAQCMRGGCTWSFIDRHVGNVRNAFAEHNDSWHKKTIPQ